MKDGLVSIIMPAYNSEKYIGETIESVLAQTYQNWELLIVDDCSTDRTPNIVRSYLAKDSRVKYYRLSQNLGAAAARNKAMYEATGEYMAFLDSDDLWYKEKLQKQTDFMNQEKINFSYTSYERIEECSNKLPQRVICPKQTSYEKLLLGNTIGNSTAMYSVKSLGKFNIPLIRKRNDYALWLRILKKEKYAVGISDVLMKYRVRSDSLSSNKIELLKYNWQLYRNIEELNMLKSLFYLASVCWRKFTR